jgi:hypothetical protein
LQSGPVSGKFANKVVSRVIEIRGDQTLDDLHRCSTQKQIRPKTESLLRNW